MPVLKVGNMFLQGKGVPRTPELPIETGVSAHSQLGGTGGTGGTWVPEDIRPERITSIN